MLDENNNGMSEVLTITISMPTALRGSVRVVEGSPKPSHQHTQQNGHQKHQKDFRLTSRRNGAKIEAYAYEDTDTGDFVVLEGSGAFKNTLQSCKSNCRRKRGEIERQRAFRDDGSIYLLTQDWRFSSSTEAGGVLLGSSCDGPKRWEEIS